MYAINRDDKKGKHWVSLFIDRNTVVYFYSFGTEYIPQDVLKNLKDKSITYAFQSKSTLCGCLNIKETTRTHNHLVRKQTLYHLAKLTK